MIFCNAAQVLRLLVLVDSCSLFLFVMSLHRTMPVAVLERLALYKK